MEIFFEGMVFDRILVALILLGTIDAVIFLSCIAYFTAEILLGARE